MNERRFGTLAGLPVAASMAAAMSLLTFGTVLAPTGAAAQDRIAPAIACESLTGLNLLTLKGAPSRVDSAEVN